jgi:hypothetical protein
MFNGVPVTRRSLLGLVAATASAPAWSQGLFGLLRDAAGAAAPTGAANVPPFDFKAAPEAQSEVYVEVVRGGNFKDIRKVGIVNFSVEFALFKEASASGGSTWRGRTASVATVTRQIPPPDPAALQAIVDALYARTQEDFKAMGIEVVPYDTLKATKNYAELKPAQHDAPWVTNTADTQSMFMAPTGMPLYMDNPERADALQAIGFSFGTNTRMKEVLMTYDLKQEVHLVSVNAVVDFATVSATGGYLSRAKATGDWVHHLHANNTSYRFVSTTQPELMLVKLRKPLTSDRPLWRDLQTETERGGDSDGTTTTSTTSTTQAGLFDTASYLKRSGDMLDASRRMFLAELKKLR